MARTTSKTQAKTKTTKKTTRAAATASPTTRKKTVAAANTGTMAGAGARYATQIPLLQKIAAAVAAASALAAGLLMNPTTVTYTTSYMARDQIASQLSGTTAFAPAIRNIWTVQLRWLVVTLFVVSAALMLLNATRWRARYVQGVRDGVQPLRWLEKGVIGALMIDVVALLSGITDIGVVKLLAALVLLSAALGWLSERQNALRQRGNILAYLLSIFAGSLPWLLLALSAVNTIIYGMIRAPWYVYALYAVTLLGFIIPAVIQWFRYHDRPRWNTTAYAERNLLLAAILTNLLFAVVLIVGFLR